MPQGILSINVPRSGAEREATRTGVPLNASPAGIISSPPGAFSPPSASRQRGPRSSGHALCDQSKLPIQSAPHRGSYLCTAKPWSRPACLGKRTKQTGTSPSPTLTFTPATQQDAAALLARGLRASDRREAWKAAGMPPEQALPLTLHNSLIAVAVKHQATVIALLGVGHSGLLSTTGSPWLVGHPDMEHPPCSLPLARGCRRFVEHWLTVFNRLENLADPNHTESMRFLEWLGMTVDHANSVRGPLGHPLVRFYREAVHPTASPSFCTTTNNRRK